MTPAEFEEKTSGMSSTQETRATTFANLAAYRRS